MRVNKTYNLIQVFTKDEIKLNGLYLASDKAKSACIFIHGFTADFYTHNFYHSVARAIHNESSSVILAQTRGTGLQTEFFKPDGHGIYIGSYHEKLEEAHLDISAFIDFLQSEGYQNIILIGHSLGTIKLIRYLFEGEYKEKVSKLVLLAPFDKNAFMEIKAPGKWHEFIDVARKKIKEGKGKEVVPVPEYEDYPLTFETFHSWYNQSDLNSMFDLYRKDYGFPILNKIDIPVKVVLGEKDEYTSYPTLGVTQMGVLDTLKKNIHSCETVLIPNCEHTFFGFEEKVAKEVASFI